MRYVKQFGTFLSLGVLMVGLAACSAEKKEGAPAPGAPAGDAPAPAGEPPKK